MDFSTYRVLGRTGIRVSPLCLGAMMFSGDGQDGKAIIDRALDAGQVDAAHDAAVEAHGRIDVGVNNAGIPFPTSLTHLTPEEEFDRVIDINLKGVWLTMRAQLRHMEAVESGVIVNMASIAGIVGAPGGAPYAASKQGIVGLTRSAAVEYARRGIRINAVAPGIV